MTPTELLHSVGTLGPRLNIGHANLILIARA